MLTIDCREAEHLKQELAVFVSDWIGAIPTMKIHEFVLSPLDDGILDPIHVIKAIKEFLASVGETANYGILAKDGTVLIKSLREQHCEQTRSSEYMFACTHCGYVTPYEVLLQNHMKMHYL